jgi:hypothetical protein
MAVHSNCQPHIRRMPDTPRITRLPDTFRWPGGRQLAVIFNIAYEAWSDGQAPGIGPMGNVLKPGFFDTNAHSWGSFGLVRGIQRLVRIAEKHQVKTSVMVNGVICERDPQMVRAWPSWATRSSTTPGAWTSSRSTSTKPPKRPTWTATTAC